MRSLIRSWLAKTERFWDYLLGRHSAPNLRVRLALNACEGRDQPGEAFASLGAGAPHAEALGLAWADGIPGAGATVRVAMTDDTTPRRKATSVDDGDWLDLPPTDRPAPTTAFVAPRAESRAGRDGGRDGDQDWLDRWGGGGSAGRAVTAADSTSGGLGKGTFTAESGIAAAVRGGVSTLIPPQMMGGEGPTQPRGADLLGPAAPRTSATAGSADATGSIADTQAGEASLVEAGTASLMTLLYPSYVLDANKGAVLTEAAPNRDFAGWAVDLKAQVAGAAVQSYSWDLSGAPDATNATGQSTYRLQFTWAGFTGPARDQTISLTTTFADTSTQTQTFAFKVDGTDSPAWASAPPTTSSSFPDVLTEDRLLAEGAVEGTGYALGLVSGKVTTSFALPAYNPDVPALALVYSSTAADARPIVRVRYPLPADAAVPATVTAKLTFNGVQSSPVVYDTSTMNAGGILEFALQADATNLPTGRYDYVVEVTGPSGGEPPPPPPGSPESLDPIPPGTVTYSGRTTVVNSKDSAFGAGWSLGGLHRLWFPSDGVVIESAGGMGLFRPPPSGGGESLVPEPVVYGGESGDFTDFVQNIDGTYTWTLTDGTKVHFSSAGLQTSVVDRNGNTTAFGYDAASRLTTITDEHGLVTTLTYDGAGKLASVADPAARSTGFTVTAGKLTAITDAAGEAWAYQYDAAGRLTRTTDPTARDVVVTYGAGGRAATAKWENGATESLTPQAVRGLAVAPQGTELDPAPAVLAVAATAAHTDGRGNGWEYRTDWSGFGSPARADVPDGGVSVTYRDGNNLPWLSADPLGRRSRSFFDGDGNPTKAVHPDDKYTQATYNGFAQPLTVTDELSRTTTYVYDAEGDLTSVTDPLGKVTTQVVNPDGTVASRTDPLNHTVTFTYDARDRLTAETDALNHSVTYGYDAKGNKTTTTDALSHTTAVLYDALNRPVRITDARSGVTQLAYDDAGRLLSLTDPVSNVTSYTYSTQVDAVATLTDPRLKVTSFGYDGEGNKTAVTDRNGRVVEAGYDAVGRPTSEVWRNTVGGPAVYTQTATYDLAGQLVSVADPFSRYAYTYDARGRVVTEDNQGTPGMPRVLLTLGYDATGNLTSAADNMSAQVGYSYSARDELSGASLTVSGVLGANTAFGYDDAGRQVSVTRREGTGGSTISSAYGYDNADRLTSITHTSSAAGGLSAFTYGYDVANRLTSYTGPDGSLSYGYDHTDQLTSVSGTFSESFGYDLNGNRNTAGYATGTGNRLTADGTYTYTHDDEGNVLTKTRVSDGEATSYTWDHRNRLTAVEVRTSGGILLKEERYTYDVQGRRIGVRTDPDGAGPQAATQLWTAYRGDNAWADFDGAGALQTRYLFGLGMDGLIARTSAAGAVGWYSTDNLGSVRQVVTTGGAVLYAANYSAFGQIRSATGTGGDRFGYAGREWSRVTGDGYYRARYYDPASGRFLAQDPMQFAANDMNLYRYVGNASVYLTDPTGLWSWEGATGGATVGAVIGGIVGAIVGGVPTIGIGAPAGAAVGAVAGAVIGFVVGGLWGDDLGHAIFGPPAGPGWDWEATGGGAILGVPSGIVGGILGPVAWAWITGAGGFAPPPPPPPGPPPPSWAPPGNLPEWIERMQKWGFFPKNP